MTCSRRKITNTMAARPLCSDTFWQRLSWMSLCVQQWPGAVLFLGVVCEALSQCAGPGVRGHGAGSMVQAWYMDDSEEDQRKPHRLRPELPVSVEELRALGVHSYQLDADNYEADPELSKIRKENNYSWMDIITIHKDTLPNYEQKLKMFYEEHLHQDDEIRYILEGSGYFDVRDKENRWIRIFMQKGDMITLPAGIYHRFTLDENNYIKAMRLFVGEPVWTPYNRPADNYEARAKYLHFLTQTA